MTENLGIGYYGIKGMKYGAVPPMPKPEPVEDDRLHIYRWQLDEMIGMMTARDQSKEHWDKVWRFANHSFKLHQLPQKCKDVPNVYIFYGYKQDATRYRLEHDIAPKDMLVASEWGKMDGRRGRPIVVNQDSEWSRLNWNHEFSVNTRMRVIELESRYGSAQ